MANYQTIPIAKPERSPQKNNIFSVGTTDFGRLQPVGTFEVVPGDKVSLSLKSFVRAAPPSVPVYGRIRVHTDAFFVPYRILWTDWDNYIAGNTDSTPPYTTIATLNSQVNAYNNLGSGIYSSEAAFQTAQDLERVLAGLKYSRSTFAPPPAAASSSIMLKRLSLFPWRAYKQIWWDYYRDSVNIAENYKSTYLNYTGGVTSSTSTDNVSLHPEVMYRCFGKDYLTTALPSANGQGPGNAANVGAISYGSSNYTASNNASYNPNNTSASIFNGGVGIPVQALRAANALQRYMEKNNIVGTRLISRLLARFGVAPSAERLQRAEYLGSNVFTMQVSDIDSSESTDLVSESQNDNVVYNAFGSSESFANIRGQATGKITGGGNSRSFNYNATEHGIIIIIQSVMPDESYYQGLDRSLIRGLSTPNSDRFDFFTPEFENLGYQPVLASDVYLPERGDNPTFYDSYDPNKVFGYQPRYSDYKFMRHMLFGDFTSSIYNTGLDSFHLFRDLSFFGDMSDQTEMVVSSTFNTLGVEERLQFDRIFQIPSAPIEVNIGTSSSNVKKTVTATLDHFQLYNSISYSGSRPMSGDDMPELVAGENDAEGAKISVPTGGIRM